MDNNSENHPHKEIIEPQIKIPAKDECIICYETAEEIAKDNDEKNIHVTACCKQFLCTQC